MYSIIIIKLIKKDKEKTQPEYIDRNITLIYIKVNIINNDRIMNVKSNKSRKFKVLPLKVSQIIIDEFLQIQDEEGLGNRSATLAYLVKEHKLRKKYEFEKAADEFEKVIDKIDKKKIPTLEEQLEI